MPKKAPKKTIKRTAPKVMPVHADAHMCHCGDACKCGCRCGKFKKFVVLLIVFLLGFAVAKMTNCRKGPDMYKKRTQERHPVFVNGCLDMESVISKKIREALQNSNVGADGCVTIAEYKAIRMGMKK